ncbi:amidohydrolase [Paracraurococcus lichenis]|uniref:Amidohydrolase n=1 Tax=Paracraurococcus lichenis TaxID=3064888 RepID=A0ABT9DTP9_9PROT|nr:amidohydrolase [Paracraurococcus sp. LOR1-02]MDO9707253.1 amidohydrolase [Paracraurococcus sp. LOR1-02]
MLLSNCRLPDGRAGMHVLVRGERVAAILDAPVEEADVVDLGGHLLLPALTDFHLHLDKSLFGLPWMPHAAGPDRMSRIETDARVLPGLPVEPRATAMLRRCIAAGTVHFRTHVDITPAFGLRNLEAVLRVREAHADACHIQTVAFPQAGVMRAPGTLDLLEEALRMGAEVLGGLDPCEVDRDPKGQLDALFALAGRHGVGLDIHLHEAGELGLFTLAEICARTRAAGMQGRVWVSHGFALGAAPEARLGPAMEGMAEAGVGLVSHGAGAAPLPPLLRLAEAGVRVCLGNDNMRDTWGPYGTGDMLERAAIVGWRLDARTDAAIGRLFAMVAEDGARALGVEVPAVAVAAVASFVGVPAEGVAEAVAQHPGRGVVVFRGRAVNEI